MAGQGDVLDDLGDNLVPQALDVSTASTASQPGITLAVAQAQLAVWLAASSAVATGQEYIIDVSGTRRKLTRVSSAEIRQQISFWSHICNQKSRPRVRFAIPTDF